MRLGNLLAAAAISMLPLSTTDCAYYRASKMDEYLDKLDARQERILDLYTPCTDMDRKNIREVEVDIRVNADKILEAMKGAEVEDISDKVLQRVVFVLSMHLTDYFCPIADKNTAEDKKTILGTALRRIDGVSMFSRNYDGRTMLDPHISTFGQVALSPAWFYRISGCAQIGTLVHEAGHITSGRLHSLGHDSDSPDDIDKLGEAVEKACNEGF